jgi:photosystem II stability/assembly factor-like uncharacterized protein
MLKSFGKFGGLARLVVTAVSTFIPFTIVGGLLYAALFVKAEGKVSEIKPPAIERRDRYLGVAMPTDKVIWAAGNNGKIIRSSDDGVKWVAQSGPSIENLQGLAAWDADKAVAVGGGGVVMSTGDGGKTWKEIPVPKSEVANKLLNVRAAEGGVAWAVGEMGAVLKTSDFGQTWDRALPEKDQAWNDISFVGEHGVMVGEFGHVMITNDGGKNWQSEDSGIKSSLMSVFLRDQSNGVAVGLSGVILTTHDGGVKWTEVAPQTREHLNSVIWDGAQWVVVGDKGVIVTGGDSGWKASHVSEGNLGWNTQIVSRSSGDSAKEYVLAGASLSRLKDGNLTQFGRSSD